MMFGAGKAKRTQRHVVTTPDGRKVEFQTPFDAPRSDILSAAQNALGQQFGGERFAQPVYGGSITEHRPGIGGRVQNSLSDALAALGVDRYRANQLGRRAFSFLDDLTPLGDITTAGNALSAFQHGQPVQGLGLTALAALGVVPGMGDVAAKGLSKTQKMLDDAGLGHLRGEERRAAARRLDQEGFGLTPPERAARDQARAAKHSAKLENWQATQAATKAAAERARD